MNKSAVIFFMLFLFSTGISIGIVISMYENADNMPKLAEQRDSIQDIVIQEIQKNQDEKYEVKEVANTEPEKISPYAKITIE